jgi:hypothetical protein
LLRGDQRRARLTLCDRGEEGRLHISGLVNPCRDAVSEQLNKELLLARGRRLEELNQRRCLLWVKR